ncbi:MULTISPECIES: AAA family ATPase [Bradyrhizobium]|uniref:AAA family ATPase n=1 Tax=Bradyrhizobium TaxID=374 RepID=UPI001BAC8EEC|nr:MULTISPECIES: AAA family ATPase [Bradyrhizobium]MBR1033858.1 AAA family ATPase [Bradyrhizobium liaoningense]MCP1774891.1 energy-coupling factor transporter ATP-binding protein EcfA2 [Bradyrhizobium japonicum]MCP1962109.1 energy-coupling factor transporter ATP-binding protein EcfA2 [Bradyrhizobium japonicum]
MTNSIEQAYERLLKLKPDIEAALAAKPNEADTRLKVLDRFLFEVLEWKQGAVFTEPPTESGYIDYLLTIGERRGAMVLEAKKAGLLQPATKTKELMVVSLSGPVVKPLLAGIKQAMGYALENGVAVAAVTDGNTWLFFRASRTDGLKPLEGKGILFSSLETVIANFAKFVELLNVSAIVQRLNLAHLADADGLAVPEAEQQLFVLDPGEASMKQRDPLASDAALLFQQFFSRLSNDKDREMLRDCFVETSESQRADFELEKIVQRVLNNISALDTAQSSALQGQIERAITTRRSETVLLVGNKGAGKSTFIDRFFEQVLARQVREKCIVARVDLEEYHADPKGIVPWAILQLRDKLEAAVCTTNPPSYDELRGIFFFEYQRLSTGSRKHLYETNRTEFRDQFGRHIEERREKQPDEYVRLLLAWAASGHQKLSCLVFDNTDQFPSEIQDMVYQLAHSLESAAPVFTIVPITDRTVWRLSKAGALQSYSAKSFYLPVPDAKEIISRRVTFLKSKVKGEPKATESYFSRRGFQVKVNDLAILADAVGKVFVENDYVSGFIGRLGNFDIRRMLKIAERIFLSPELAIDDIIKSKFSGEDVTTDRVRTHRALVRGEYDRFSERENEFISNLFQTNPQKPGPPLLGYYILWILRRQMHNARNNQDENIETAHWAVSSLVQFFEGCGVAEELVVATVNRLYDRRLIEALDPNVQHVTVADKVAIKESGIAHLELLLSSPVYIDQMGLVTGINEPFARDEIKKALTAGRFGDIREQFLRYILKIDSGRITIPSNEIYGQLAMARKQIERMTSQGSRAAR